MSQASATALVTARALPGEVVSEVVTWPLRDSGEVLAVGVLRTVEGARRVALDSAGREVDFDVMLAIEARNRMAAVGKMSDDLFALQAEADEDDVLEFDVIVAADVRPSKLPYDGTDQPVSIAELDAFVTMENERQRRELDAAKRSVRTWLEDQGAEIVDLRGLPALTVRGRAGLLRKERLHADDVSGLETTERGGVNLGYASHAAMNEAVFSGGQCGGPCTGNSLAIGITEFNTAPIGMRHGIATLNSRLQGGGVTYREAPSSCSSHTQCQNPMELDNKCVGGKCVGLHVSAVAGSMGMAGSYTYDAGVLGPSAVTFPSSGTYDLNRYIAVTGSPLADIDWLLDSTPVRNINRSATNTPASVVCWAARIKSVGCGSIGTVLDGRNLDHLTSLSRGRSRGSGLGTSPSA